MSSAVQTPAGADYTAASHVFRRSVQLGLIESALIFVFAMVSKHLDGPVELGLESLLLLGGLAAVTLLPGLWTRARTIEGIAGAAGIGLGAAGVFLLIDSLLFQQVGIYGNRWLAIGGGSNWWYHPVWWMAGTFLPWFGAWILANQAERSGGARPVAAFGTALVCTAVVTAAAVLLHVPGAAWGVGTFGVAYLAGLSLATAFSSLGARRA